MSVQFTAGRFAADDDAGNPLVGGLLYTYASGTIDKKATYTSSTLGTANTNPVVLDARGEAQVWLGSGAYTMVLKTSAGSQVWSVDGITDGSLGENISVNDGASGTLFTTVQGFINYVKSAGASFISFIQNGTGAVSRTVQEKLRESVSIVDFGASDPTGNQDCSQAFQNAVNSSKIVYVPAGSWRINSTVTVPSGVMIYGEGHGSSILAYGCDAFTLSAGASLVTIQSLHIFSYAGDGTPDPRSFVAIFCSGTNSSNINYVTLRDLYLQGWADAVNFRYTWNSRLDNVTSINSNNGFYVYGQSVNNTVTGCRFVSNGGNSSIWLVNDGSTIGEGLMVSDSLMSSGAYGVLTGTGFLSLHISNCVIDLIGQDAIKTTDCKDLRISNSWMYAVKSCIRLQALGAVDTQCVSISGNGMRITDTSGTSRVIEQGGANIGLSVNGNRFTFGGLAQGIYLDGQSASIDSNHFDNTGTGTSIVVNGSVSTHKIGKNTGAATVSGLFGTPEYTEGNWIATDRSGAGLSISDVSQARYVKNGKMTTVHLDIRYPITTDVSQARLSLPFQPDAGAQPAGVIGFQDINGVFMPVGSTSSATFVFWKPGASGAYATNANLSGARFVVTFTYRAAS